MLSTTVREVEEKRRRSVTTGRPDGEGSALIKVIILDMTMDDHANDLSSNFNLHI